MTAQTFQFIMQKGPTPGLVFELTKSEMYIGRDVTNDIVINEAEVSRRHARLALEAGRYKIEDLGSTNGVFVNGQRLMGPHLLAAGELVMLGENVSLVYEVLQFDPGATVVSASARPAQPAPPVPPVVGAAPQAPAYRPAPPPAHSPPPQPVYAQQIPAGPADYPAEEEVVERKPLNTWLLAGCGCLLVILCMLLVLFIFIDQPWNPGGGLYCTPPFDLIFRTFGFCP